MLFLEKERSSAFQGQVALVLFASAGTLKKCFIAREEEIFFHSVSLYNDYLKFDLSLMGNSGESCVFIFLSVNDLSSLKLGSVTSPAATTRPILTINVTPAKNHCLTLTDWGCYSVCLTALWKWSLQRCFILLKSKLIFVGGNGNTSHAQGEVRWEAEVVTLGHFLAGSSSVGLHTPGSLFLQRFTSRRTSPQLRQLLFGSIKTIIQSLLQMA